MNFKKQMISTLLLCTFLLTGCSNNQETHTQSSNQITSTAETTNIPETSMAPTETISAETPSKTDASNTKKSGVLSDFFEDPVLIQYIAEELNKSESDTVTADELATISHIYIYEENLHSLQGIEYLYNLESLDVSFNKIEEIPESIVSLTKLDDLDISANNLTEFPECITQITQLTSLSIGKNQLTSLPDSIGNLINLESLTLTNNSLKEIPEVIAKMTNIDTLYMDENEFSQFPEFMADLSNLRILSLEGNNIKHIDVALLKKLTKLEYLLLDGNPLDNEAEIKKAFPNLKYTYAELIQGSLDALENEYPELEKMIDDILNS